MNAVDYIDWDEREFPDASASVAVNECGNCGCTCETLHHVPEFDYMGCDDCLDEAMEIIASEKAQPKRVTPAGTIACVHCKTKAARWDSIYCSDSCKRAFLTFGEVA